MTKVQNPNPTETAAEPAMRILMAASCPALSGASQISFLVSCPVRADDVSSICFKIAGASGGGKYNATYVSIAAIERALSKIPTEQTFSASAFKPLYLNGSSNSPGFLAAILLSVGLIARAPDSMAYVRHTAKEFWKKIEGLVATGVDLQPAAMEQGDSPMSSCKSEPVGRKPKKSKPTATTAPATTAES